MLMLVSGWVSAQEVISTEKESFGSKFQIVKVKTNDALAVKISFRPQNYGQVKHTEVHGDMITKSYFGNTNVELSKSEILELANSLKVFSTLGFTDSAKDRLDSDLYMKRKVNSISMRMSYGEQFVDLYGSQPEDISNSLMEIYENSY